jgi:hypothetical protein
MLRALYGMFHVIGAIRDMTEQRLVEHKCFQLAQNVRLL